MNSIKYNMNEQPADLVLVLKDDLNEMTIDVHKNILATNSPYFSKLFSILKEKDQDKITIQVSNINITHDIIMNFYGQKNNSTNVPKWKYDLETVKCLDYLGIYCDATLISNIKVPPEGYDLLLDVIEIIGYDEETIKLISDNLPNDYDVSKFPKELIDAIIKVNTVYHIISGSVDETINVWTTDPNKTGTKTCNPNKTLVDHNNSVNCICFSPDSQKFASGSSDKTIKIWDALSCKLIRTLPINTSYVTSICFLADSRRIVSGYQDKSIKIWDTVTGKLIQTFMGTIGIAGGHTLAISSIHSFQNLQNHTELIVSGSVDKTIKIWDILTGKLLQTLDGHTDWVKSVYFSPNGQQIVSGSLDKTIKIWDTLSGKLLQTLDGHSDSDPISSVCYSPNGEQIISGNHGDFIKIWDANTGKLIQILKGHTNSITSVCYSSDNRRIISAGNDKTIRLWDAYNGNLIQIFTGHSYSIRGLAVAVSLDHNLIKRLSK